MNPIKDIREELNTLIINRKKIRILTIGLFFISVVYGLVAFLKHHALLLPAIVGIVFLLLLLWSFIYPLSLQGFYRSWMAVVFSIGWLVSRVLLLIVFYLILSPLGLLARLVGKEFLDTDFSKKKDSYWVAYDKERPGDYKRMY